MLTYKYLNTLFMHDVVENWSNKWITLVLQ